MSAQQQINKNPEQKEEVKQVNLLDIEIKNENDALNVMVGFLGLAQKRGVFAINEASKIYECIKKFQKDQ
mgnify:CR=1 FL=1|jgi:glutathione synthase/RimK-type ligase-like ATP-grasp enzyme|tara:strand:+ start:436 stop:645 length:210 start_codon:yes stop_codon:yes gene_type:complete